VRASFGTTEKDDSWRVKGPIAKKGTTTQVDPSDTKKYQITSRARGGGFSRDPPAGAPTSEELGSRQRQDVSKQNADRNVYLGGGFCVEGGGEK